MKPLKLFCRMTLLVIAALVTFTEASASEDQLKFTVKGEIEGLAPGDTLTFYRVILPQWDYEVGFRVIVDDPGRFCYTGTHPHSQLYRMNYRPISGVYDESSKWGVDIMLRNDTINITGRTTDIYYSIRSGGVFDDPLLSRLYHLEDSMRTEWKAMYQELEDAEKYKDSVKFNEYADIYNNWYGKEEYEQMSELSN